MQTILVCDDDKEIVDAIDIYLTGEGFHILKAYDGYDALKILETEHADLMIIDVMMPGLDGIRTTLKVRETSSIPIIILSAKSEDSDKILGLNIGADDYLSKPFNPLELVARVKSQLRRYTQLGNLSQGSNENVYKCGGLTINDDTKEVFVDDEPIKLTPIEYNILLLLTKNEKLKSICSASGVSALLGITEPAMFGVTLKLKYPFYAAIIGSGVGSAYLAWTKTLAQALGAAGLPGFISMKPEDYGHFAIGLILSMAVSFGLTVVFWKKMGIEKETAEVEAKTTDADKEAEVNSDVKATTDEIKLEAVVTEPEETAETAQENQELTFTSPMKGKVLPVTESADEMFASKMLGDGIAVEAADGTVYAPCDGTVSLLFPTKHAVGIKSADGVELLIHVGINTVQLDGEGFEAFVTQGDTVKKGDKLLKADLDFIREKGLNPQTMMIFPEAMNLDITPLSSENADENTAAVKVTRK